MSEAWKALWLFIVAVLVGLLFTAALAFGLRTARAHEHWISRGGYYSPIDGSHCCGENDCFEFAEDDVSRTSKGDYFIRSLLEIVPETEAQVSKDGRFWRCRYGGHTAIAGKRRCFFAPPGTM